MVQTRATGKPRNNRRTRTRYSPILELAGTIPKNSAQCLGTRHIIPDRCAICRDRVRLKAVEIANALLEEGYDEGKAIRIAIAKAKEWAENHRQRLRNEVTSAWSAPANW